MFQGQWFFSMWHDSDKPSFLFCRDAITGLEVEGESEETIELGPEAVGSTIEIKIFAMHGTKALLRAVHIDLPPVVRFSASTNEQSPCCTAVPSATA